MLKVRALMNINAFMLRLTISLSTIVVGCASTSTSQSEFKNNRISAISKSTVSAAGEPINIDTHPTEVVWQLMPEAPGELIAQGNGSFVSIVKPMSSPEVIAEVGINPMSQLMVATGHQLLHGYLRQEEA